MLVVLFAIAAGVALSWLAQALPPFHDEFADRPLPPDPLTRLAGKSPEEVEAALGVAPTKFLERAAVEKALHPRRIDQEPDGKNIGAVGRWLKGGDEIIVIFDRDRRAKRVLVNGQLRVGW